MNNLLSTGLSLSPIMLAQFVPSASHSQILTVLLGGAALLVIANQAFSFWKNATGNLKEIPPPAQTYVPITRCAEEHKKNADEHTSMAATLRTIGAEALQRSDAVRKEIKDDVKGIHARIDDVLKAVSRLEGRQS